MKMYKRHIYMSSMVDTMGFRLNNETKPHQLQRCHCEGRKHLNLLCFRVLCRSSTVEPGALN